jgi:hypothetical protein
MQLDKIRTAIEDAISISVHEIQLPGIEGADVQSVTGPSEQLQLLATQLEQRGQVEIRLSADVQLYLRISNTDVLRSIESTEFRVAVEADGIDLRAAASTDKDWAKAWERGIEPIRAAALQSMEEDLRSMGATLAEDSYAFQAAMVLLASELVGPYPDRIATLLRYSPGLVQVIAARLHEAQIWESDEVRCERWFDPEKGAISFLLDWIVAEGKFVRRWSEEKNDFEYRIVEVQPCSRLTV